MRPAAKVSEQVNGNCPSRNMILQLSTPYTDPSLQTAQPKISRIYVSGIAIVSMLTMAIPDCSCAIQ